jgi:2-polyprenyl-3-methyl-5-hydroxy-6-metoxy-1,4-benzoquinol methylase
MCVACLICGQSDFSPLFDGRVIDEHVLRRCSNCGMVQAFAAGRQGPKPHDYSGYGDYLLVGTDSEIRRNIDHAGRVMRPWFEMIARRSRSAAVLDFGSGAGYLARAAAEFGFEASGVEISSKLVTFSKERVGLGNVYPSLEAAGRQFDAIFMADVIEHLDPAASRAVMTELVGRLRPGGLLVGNTPNIGSANVRLHRDRDPIVAPPSHVCYFSRRTLDRYLTSLGLVKQRLYTSGLSQDSFLRPSKFEPSFLEKPWRTTPIYLLPLRLPLKIGFRAAGFPLRLLGMGYQIYFAYARSEARPA